MLLLDFIRYQQNLTGTKIGCREGDCGACTVLVGEVIDNELIYHSVTSCLMAIGNAHGKHIVTIEGVNIIGLNYIQQAFSDEGATQCGFCTPGFIVSLAGFCLSKKEPAYQHAVDAVNGNICRCTGYKSIERAAEKISDKLKNRNGADPITYAVSNSILPEYFLTVKEQLIQLISRINKSLKSSGAASKYLGGGTDLYVQQHETMVDEEINFLLDTEHLNGIEQRGSRCYMGASTTVSDLMDAPVFNQHFPDLYKYLKLISSTQIRNMATVAGNFVNASPIGDLTIFFLALDAQLILSNGTASRELPLRKFYKGYKMLDKNPEEYIEKIYFELPAVTDKFNFEKVCKRTHLDIASVNTALYLKMNGEQIVTAGISAGGVGPVPAYLSKSSAYLDGKNMAGININELLSIIQTEVTPISDARGTDTYKRLLLGQLIKAHFMELFPQHFSEKILTA